MVICCGHLAVWRYDLLVDWDSRMRDLCASSAFAITDAAGRGGPAGEPLTWAPTMPAGVPRMVARMVTASFRASTRPHLAGPCSVESTVTYSTRV